MFYPSKIRDQGSVPQLSGETMVTVQCTGNLLNKSPLDVWCPH